MFKKWRWVINRPILFIGTLVIFLLFNLWLFVYYEINSDYNRTLDEASKETMNLVKTFEEHVRGVLVEADKDLLSLKRAYEHNGITSPIFIFYWETVTKDPSRAQIAVVDRQGVVIKSLIGSSLNLDISLREYFLDNLLDQKQGLYIGRTIKSISTGQDVIPLIRRLDNPDGSFGGLIYIGLTTSYFNSFYQKINLGRDQLIELSGTDGFNRTRRSNDNEVGGQDISGSAMWKEIQNGKLSSTYISANGIDGAQWITSYNSMPDYPLIVIVGKATNEAFKDFNKRKQHYIIGAGSITFILLSGGFLLVLLYKRQYNLNKELSRLDRLNLVGEMAASIGHEVRNPLTTVRGYLQWFLGKEKYGDMNGQLAVMIDELDRANSIITEFLSLAKNKAVLLKPGNINNVLATLFPLLQAEALQLNRNLKLETTDITDTLFDENEIRQLILNLVHNGYEAMGPGDTLTLKTYCENNFVVLAVCDTGKGIPPSIIDKLGTPFLSTKDSGSGLGLAVCYRIADRHNAKIEVKTSQKGTAFYIKFPKST